MNSRSKGKRGELELCAFLREHGHESARRGQQYSGTETSADVVDCLPGYHVECKRTEKGNPYDWLDQAIRDSGVTEQEYLAGVGKAPVVFHKRNRRDWIVVMRAEDFLRLDKAARELVRAYPTQVGNFP